MSEVVDCVRRVPTWVGGGGQDGGLKFLGARGEVMGYISL